MIVSEGQYVLLEFEDSIHLLQAKSPNKTKLKKGVLIKGKDIIGQNLGVKLTVNVEGHIEKASLTHHTFAENYINENQGFGDGSKVIDKKESHSIDVNIYNLIKQESSSSTDIVNKIISKSQSFSDKTRYSQYKYIIKKLKKHHPIFVILPCDSNHLSRFYFQKMPEKTCFLRSDRLAQILYFASIAHDSNVILVEDTQGLLVGSVLERIESGNLLQVYFGQAQPEKKALTYMSLENEKYDLVKFKDIENGSKIIENNFHCLIIVSKWNPLDIVKRLSPYLMSSTPVVVFSQVLEPLVEVYTYFKQSGKGFDTYITETWLRSMKVQENSTHPNVLMDDRSGYIFRCYYIS